MAKEVDEPSAFLWAREIMKNPDQGDKIQRYVYPVPQSWLVIGINNYTNTLQVAGFIY